MTTEYVQRFGYRKYDGSLEPRWKRILSLAWFECTSTWRKSTLGKVLLIIIIVLNFLSITVIAAGSNFLLANLTPTQRAQTISSSLYRLVADYLPISSGVGGLVPAGESLSSGLSLSINLGFLLIALLAIAGSGLLADDKQGRTLEIYLSKLQKGEYITGKILAIMFYINIFVTLPLLILGILFVQAFGLNQFDYLSYYFGIIIYGIVISLLFGLVLLVFSSIAEKRSYASLGFYLLFFVGSIFQTVLIAVNPNNQFFLLLPFSGFLQLLAYTILGNYNLAIITGTQVDQTTSAVTNSYALLNLNDGIGLEWYDVYLMAIGLIVIMILFLAYKVRKLTTEDL